MVLSTAQKTNTGMRDGARAQRGGISISNRVVNGGHRSRELQEGVLGRGENEQRPGVVLIHYSSNIQKHKLESENIRHFTPQR